MSIEQYKKLADDVLEMVKDVISLRPDGKTLKVDPRNVETKMMVQMAKAILELTDDNLKLKYNGMADLKSEKIRISYDQTYRSHSGIEIRNNSRDYDVFEVTLTNLTKNNFLIKTESVASEQMTTITTLTAERLRQARDRIYDVPSAVYYAGNEPRPILPIQHSPVIDESIARYQREVSEMNRRDAEIRARSASFGALTEGISIFPFRFDTGPDSSGENGDSP